jgi:cold shock CspA family protein
MAKSQDSWNKREKEKQREKKREDKDKKKADRKANSEKGGGFDSMIAYVDEFGMISSTPPDPSKKQKINAEDIEIGIPKREDIVQEDPILKGVVTFFDQSKGFGFIKVAGSGESVFVHIKSCSDPIKENDKVAFETENGPRGVNAFNVKLDS